MSLYDVATAIFIQNFQKRAPINTTKSSHFDTFFCFSIPKSEQKLAFGILRAIIGILFDGSDHFG